MRHLLLLAALAAAAPAQAAGLLIPVEKTLPPLAMLNHQVRISIEEQVAITTVEQTFRNHTDRQLEATYLFPVPKGASLDRFTMTVDGKEQKGEMLPADKARDIYTSIVRQTKDPGLLEYVGTNVYRMRVFPVPPRGDQKVSIRFHSVAPRDGKLIQYVYPLKNDGKAVETLEKFSVSCTVKAAAGLTNVYSPSHALALTRVSDKEVKVGFDKEAGALDRDFVLYYSTSKDDIGLTALTHRPLSAEKGFATLLIAPKFSLGEKYRIQQDMVFVLDTSGSMRGPKMEQAQKAMRYCLSQLKTGDRFALINFATTVDRYEEKLVDATNEQLTKAGKWVDALEATGGTNIDAALASALELRPKDSDRPFTIVFFTDGQPTIGETNPETIFKNAVARNTASTRIFTFGVGDDVNTALLDRLAEKTRALSAYVRPEEKIEEKVSSLYGKMSNPVLTNLKLTTTGDVKLAEVYPAELPDLFHGGQLEVMCRFSGKGPSAIKLTGLVGKEKKEFVYELTFPEKTEDGKEFVEQLWARRKVGFLLDQIRINGEKDELKKEVVALAKKYGITTPYTSWLIVPDAPVPVAGSPGGSKGGGKGPIARAGRGAVPPGLGGGFGFGGGTGGFDPKAPMAPPRPVLDFAKDDKEGGEGRAGARVRYAEGELKARAKDKGKPGDGKSDDAKKAEKALEEKDALDKARKLFARRDRDGATTGKLGVDLAVQVERLRSTSRLERAAIETRLGRQMMEVGGVWIDEAFTPKTEAVVVKAMSDAYFDILKAHPEAKKMLQLGNHLVWVTPSGKALVIDAGHGKEKLTAAEIKALFTAKK
ncbi:MAG: VIT and VWA domain-containing protein [Gemmataceae bacterium]|nr:VIT and VWA domain-containing protein [Gemmataceae bacterium]